MFWESIGGADLGAMAAGVREAAEDTRTSAAALAVYGNPLRGDAVAEETLRSVRALIEAAPAFSDGRARPIVATFAGRVPGASVPASLEAWRAAFAPLAERAEALGVVLAFENCRMGDTWKTGKWNIAINPDAWNLMFAALPSASLALEWEPCHQVEALADPVAQLERWAPRIAHVHGKDARLDRALLAAGGLYGASRWSASCFPGNGDTDWKEIFRVLSAAGYGGTIDIEGWNDAEWSGERELEGQLRALGYLRACRPG